MRTVSPQKKFPSLNPDYVFGSNTAGNFIPPYTGYYYMRAVGGGGSGSLRSDFNDCIGGGAGGGYDGEIFLEGGVGIPYSVGTGGVAVTMGNWGNNGTDTRFGFIVLGGGYGGMRDGIPNSTPPLNGGRGGTAGNCKGGACFLPDTVNPLYIYRATELAQSSDGLYGGGGGMTYFHSEHNSSFNYLANSCGKSSRIKEHITSFNDSPHYVRLGGCSIFGVPPDYFSDYSLPIYGAGGSVHRGISATKKGQDGRIEIWRLQ